MDVCSLTDGRVYLILGNMQVQRLMELDPATGFTEEIKLARMISPGTGSLSFATGNGTLLLYNDGSVISNKEITALNPADGTENSIFSFEGTSYMPAYAHEMSKCSCI